MNGFSFPDLCRSLGKDAFYVKNLQRQLDLYVPSDGQGYPESYVIFMEKVIALRAFHVPANEIEELFETEKKILHLLHVDSLSPSPTWYLDLCSSADLEASCGQLLLSGYKLGFAMDAGAIQHTLDFGGRDAELFKGSEMGEDVRRVLAKYVGLLDGVRGRIEKEKPILENALLWARRFLRK